MKIRKGFLIVFIGLASFISGKDFLMFYQANDLRLVRDIDFKFKKIPMDLSQIPENTFLDTNDKDQYFLIKKEGTDFAYARLNEELAILEIEPISLRQISDEESRYRFYEGVLEFCYYEVIAKNKGIELITRDGDLMKLSLARKEMPELKSLEFSTDILEGIKHWYGKDNFFQMEFKPKAIEGKIGMLTFVETMDGISAIIQPKITVLVNGYGTIGSKVALAARYSGFNVVVAKRTVDEIGRAKDAIEKGFPLYLSGDAEFYQENKDKFEKAGIPVQGSIEGLLSRHVVDVVIDASPKPYGAMNKETFYDLYGVKSILQGGEKAKVVDISFSSSTTPWEKLKDVNSVRVVSCNTIAMTRIYGAILKHFKNVVIDNIAMRRAVDPWQSGDKGMIDSAVLVPAYHHGPDFLTTLSEELLSHIAIINGEYAINTDAGKIPTTHFHLHQGTVRLTEYDPAFTPEKIKEILKEESRVALVEFPNGEFKTNVLFEVIDKQLATPDAYVVIAQVLPSSISGEIKVTFAVPQESDVVPENINALQALFGIFPEKGAIRIVNKVLNIYFIKSAIEERISP